MIIIYIVAPLHDEPGPDQRFGQACSQRPATSRPFWSREVKATGLGHTVEEYFERAELVVESIRDDSCSQFSLVEDEAIWMIREAWP